MPEKKKRTKGQPWTPEHDEILRKLKSVGGSYAEMAKRTGRTPAAVGQRLLTLGLTSTRTRKPGATKSTAKHGPSKKKAARKNGHSEAAVARSKAKLEAARQHPDRASTSLAIPQTAVVPAGLLPDPEEHITVVVNGLPLQVPPNTLFTISPSRVVHLGDSVFMVPRKIQQGGE